MQVTLFLFFCQAFDDGSWPPVKFGIISSAFHVVNVGTNKSDVSSGVANIIVNAIHADICAKLTNVFFRNNWPRHGQARNGT